MNGPRKPPTLRDLFGGTFGDYLRAIATALYLISLITALQDLLG